MVAKRKVVWKQCPYCAAWFIAHGRQVYCTPKCGNRFWGKYRSLMNQKKISYVSVNGEMYESKRVVE